MSLKDLKKKIKNAALNIGSPALKRVTVDSLKHLNEWHSIYEDILWQFRNVKLYRKEHEIDYEMQWQARSGVDKKSENAYNLYTNDASDPNELDDTFIRKDDLFMLDYLPQGCSCLELGCGNGRLGQLLKKKKNIEYVGLEYSKTAVEKASSKGLEAYVCDLNDLGNNAFEKIKGRKFDFVISVWVIDILRNQEALLQRLFDFADVQIHGFWNAGHWTARLRMLGGRFPIYCFNSDENGKLIYPYIYGTTNRYWTLSDFKAYAKELGYETEAIGVGPKFGIDTAIVHKNMFWPAMRAGRVIWKIQK